MAIADLNGDGRPDLAITNGLSANVSVLLNTTTPGATTPSYAARTDFTTGNGPDAVAIGDFDGDGQPDLAIANFGSNSVSMLLNRTTPGATAPNYATKTDFTTGSYPSSIAIGDLNGDGQPDLAISNYSSDSVSVLLNQAATIGDSQGTGTITNDDVVTPTVSVAVSPAAVDEDGTAALVYTFTRTGETTAALPVSYEVSGSATSDSDFTALSGTVTIPIGQVSATVTVDPTDDTTVEPDETIILTVTDAAAYDVGTPAAATGTISNDDDVAAGPIVEISPTGPGGSPDPDDLPSGPQPTSWSMQRSDLREIVIKFNAPITNPTASNLVLTNLGVNAPLDPDSVIELRDNQLALSSDGMELRISLDANQLSDGVYQLELSSAITGGSPFTITGNADNGFFVLAGDWNGTGGVNIQDFATFAYWFGNSVPTAPEYVDVNNSGGLNIQDFSVFAANFAANIVFPDGVAASSSNSGGEGELTSSLRTLLTPTDVNGDGSVTVRDALNVINQVDRNVANGVDAAVTDGWSKFDVNRNGRITSLDALVVINQLIDSATPDQAVLAVPASDDEGEQVTVADAVVQPIIAAKSNTVSPLQTTQAVDAVWTQESLTAEDRQSEPEPTSLNDTIELLSRVR